MKASYFRYVLDFKQASGTSRGILKQKETWFIKVEHQNKWGIGECGILRGLSCDDRGVDVSAYERANLMSVDYDETDLSLVRMISDMKFPEFPVPMGIIKRVKSPTFDDAIHEQIESAKTKFKPDLEKLISSGDTWEVK